MENFIFLLLSFVVVIANDNLVFLREHVIVYIPQIYVTQIYNVQHSQARCSNILSKCSQLSRSIPTQIQTRAEAEAEECNYEI